MKTITIYKIYNAQGKKVIFSSLLPVDQPYDEVNVILPNGFSVKYDTQGKPAIFTKSGLPTEIATRRDGTPGLSIKVPGFEHKLFRLKINEKEGG